MPRKERLPKNVSSFIDRHGKLRYRFRKTGLPPRSFKHHPNGKDGKAELALFRKGKSPDAVERYPRGTVGWLAAIYRDSLAFTGEKNEIGKRNAWAIIEKFISEFAHDKIADFRFSHIEAILLKASKKRQIGKRTVGGPHAALNLRGELLPFFNFAIKHELIANNPVSLAAKPSAPKSTGFHTWTEVEIAAYRKTHSLGTMARFVLELALNTSGRRCNLATLGPRDIVNGRIVVDHAKNGNEASVRMLATTKAAYDALPVKSLDALIVTSFGKPFSVAGLGNKMREWCDAADLPHCSMHGLRKATSRRVAESGGTDAEGMSVTGHKKDETFREYRAAANRAALADEALDKVAARFDLANHEGTK
jgi:integrase